MQEFVKKAFLFSSLAFAPYVILVIIFLLKDPFRIHTYPPYIDGFHHINRGVVTTSGYLKSSNLNTIIFGNSRSISIRCDDLIEFCHPCKKCFHFDASDDNLHGFAQKVKLIAQHQDSLNEAFIFLDDQAISTTPIQPNKFPFVRHPVYGEKTWIEFYFVFLSQYLKLPYQYAHLTKNYSMGQHWVQEFNYKDCGFEESSADFMSAKENQIKLDSLSFYRNNSELPEAFEDVTYHMSSTQQDSLQQIIESLEALGAQCTIIFHPRYTRTHPSIETLDELKMKMPQTNVFDATNFDIVLNNDGYWYETSHFRPIAGKMILEAIYSGEIPPHALQLP